MQEINAKGCVETETNGGKGDIIIALLPPDVNVKVRQVGYRLKKFAMVPIN